MNLVYSIIFIISAILVAIFDFKYQKIPYMLIIINYVSLSLIIHPIFLIGILAISIAKKLDKPIDIIYLILIGYLTIINNNVYSILSIFILLITIVASKRNPLSFMVPIEIICIIEILRRLL